MPGPVLSICLFSFNLNSYGARFVDKEAKALSAEVT